MALWIQGLFFQYRERLEFEDPRGLRGELRVRFMNRLAQYMYRGSIWRSDADVVNSPYVGAMEDAFGVSSILEVEYNKDRLAFTKMYKTRADRIRYTFDVRDGLTLVGRWSGRRVGRGIARCLITEVPDEFFTADSINTALGESVAPRDRGIPDGGELIF